jgi:adenine phosphoribosyltransferase
MTEESLAHSVKNLIREVPDFPKQGINFYDITPVLQNGKAFMSIVQFLVKRYESKKPDVILAIEARGFIFGAPLASALGVSFVPVRKAGKLPSETETSSYALEYGEDSLEIHTDALEGCERVLVIDDLLATGGTAASTGSLVRKLGGNVLEYCFIIELIALGGREKLAPSQVFSLLQYAE